MADWLKCKRITDYLTSYRLAFYDALFYNIFKG